MIEIRLRHIFWTLVIGLGAFPAVPYVLGFAVWAGDKIN